MNKRDALKLRPGQCIIYGDSMWSVDCLFRIYAEVLFVTEKGGIRVRNQHGQELWVPYHHVINSDAGVCWWKEDSFVTDDVK